MHINKLREEFLYPSSEYTPIPFWFWNDHLEEDEIIRQIHDFKDKGVDGFVIHPRIGIPKEIGYLSDRFMELIECAVKEAARLDTKVILYDEGMYPSGSANGMVVRSNPEFASRGLKMIPYECNNAIEIPLELEDGEDLVAALAAEKRGPGAINPDSVRVLDVFDGKISFSPPGKGEWQVLLFIETYSKGHIRGIHFGEDDGEPNAPPSTDLLNPKAVEKFIELTHERYYKWLYQYFGTTIIGIFTDEPAILGRGASSDIIPWTWDFLGWYMKRGNDIKDLPALWLDIGPETQLKRKQYRKAVNKRLETAYYKQIYQWCDKHGIALTGHPESSDDIGVLKYFHIPGQDVVWRWVAPEDGKALEGVHSTQGKCSSDAARHLARRRNSNECFGCCGPNGVDWAFTVDDMKWYMDWLFVRGVNLLYPHAFFYSIEGERRYGERPPDVGPNNLWWPYYNQISSYIKRMSWLMTDAVNVTSVAVLCQEDKLPWAIVKPLFENQIEFNYLQEELFSEGDIRIEDGSILIQKQRYGALVIEDFHLISPFALDKIQEFIHQGGHVIIYNPNHSDINLTDAKEIHKLDEVVDILNSLIGREILLDRPCRDLRLSHVVKDDIHFYLLVNEGGGPIDRKMAIPIVGQAEQWDAWNGKTDLAFVSHIQDDKMVLDIRLDRRESLIIVVDPSKSASLNPIKESTEKYELKVLDEGWKILNAPVPKVRKLGLRSWTECPGMEEFSGTLVYENSFMLNSLMPDSIPGKGQRIYLDLGRVHDIAHVQINGKSVGVKMWAPYIFDITQFISIGQNTIKIEVTNTIANRICGLKLPSGLLGPIRVCII